MRLRRLWPPNAMPRGRRRPEPRRSDSFLTTSEIPACAISCRLACVSPLGASLGASTPSALNVSPGRRLAAAAEPM